MKVTIDGNEIEVNLGETILEAAKRAGVGIPTLCYSEAFGGQGVCRMCMVEVKDGDRKRLVASCTYPITGEIEVQTNTPELREIRSNIITLLYRRAPNSEFMKKLHQEYECTAVEPVDAEEKCIMCRLCIKACEKVGAYAISTIMRGTEKRVATPFDESSPNCIGCSACADICPTGAISVKKENGRQEIWHKSFEMPRCEMCGNYFSTLPVKEHVKEQLDFAVSGENLCPSCRRKKLARDVAEVSKNR
ncbi:MAG: 2Fe-2S iron-sulfur cluster-binding protein [Thermacetogeniaceae bacterium]|jgi:NADH dehydrogenase/NADH:ubiquinone oxidoreductase subunit G|nr:2Fe-2S iron-sulfur cluster-binding protein [Thermoanaerobacterales bacterium]NLN21701.1 2Fe-2S iron-sulfur cluster binding domain-containing protein [Syntrophomonadaceae bacterium]HAF17520.1 2Fe-2S ferredoxin [Peptococcaceae bacterium]